MADNIKSCNVKATDDNKFEFSATCDADSDGFVQVRANGKTISPGKRKVTKGKDKSVEWTAEASPKPAKGTRFFFWLRSATGDRLL